MNLEQKVRDFIEETGVAESAKVFDVSQGTISNWRNGKPPSIRALEIVLSYTGDKLDVPIATPEQEPLTQWEGRELAILLPTYRTQNPDTHFTLFANYAQYGPQKIAMPKPVKGTCIWEARNKLINKGFGIESVKKVIMCDDDMILPFGMADNFNYHYGTKIPAKAAAMNAISRLMSHPSERGIVGALYFGRHRRGKAQCQIGFNTPSQSEDLRKGKLTGLIPMDWVGTGFIRIERWVIEEMDKAIAGGKFPECKPTKEGLPNGYFAPLRVGVGEDLSFCLRAKDIGIQTYLDADLVCLHAGEEFFGTDTRDE